MKINRLFIMSLFLMFLLIPEFSTGFSVALDTSIQNTEPIQTISVGATATETINIMNNNGNGFYYLNIPSSGVYNLSMTAISNTMTSINAQILGLVNVTGSNIGSYQLPYTVFTTIGQSSSTTPLNGLFILPAVFSSNQLGLTLNINSQSNSITIKITITNASSSAKSVSSKINLPQCCNSNDNFFSLDTSSLGISTSGFYKLTTLWDLQTSSFSSSIYAYGSLQVSQNSNAFNPISTVNLYSNYQISTTTETTATIYIDPSANNLIELSGYQSSSGCSGTCTATLTATVTSAQKITPDSLNSGQPLTVSQNKLIQLNVSLNNFYTLNTTRTNSISNSNSILGTPQFSSSLNMPGTNGITSGNSFSLNSFNSFEFYYGKSSVSYTNLEYSPNIAGLSTPEGGIDTIQGFTTYNNSYFYTQSVNFDIGSSEVTYSSLDNQTTGIYIMITPINSITLSLSQFTPETLPLNTTINLDPTNPDQSAKIYQINTAQNDIIEYSTNMKLNYQTQLLNSGYYQYFDLSSSITGTGTGLFNSNYLNANTTVPYEPLLFTTSSGISYIFITSSLSGYLNTYYSLNTLQSVYSLIQSRTSNYSFMKTKIAQFPNEYSNIFYTASETIFTLPVSSSHAYSFKLGGVPFAQSAGFFILLDQNGNALTPDGSQGLAGYIVGGYGYSLTYKPVKSQTLYLIVYGQGVITMQVHEISSSNSSPGFETFITFFALLAIMPMYLYKRKKKT